MATGVTRQVNAQNESGTRTQSYERRGKSRSSDKTDGRSPNPSNYSSGFGGEGTPQSQKVSHGTRDTMSTGDMADMLPLKVSRINKTKAKLDERKKNVPAGAQGGALGNAPLHRVTSGLRTVFRARGGSPAGNPTGEINYRA